MFAYEGMRFTPDCPSAYSLGQCTAAVMVMAKPMVWIMIIGLAKLMVLVRVTVMDKLMVWVRARLPTNMHSSALV